MPEAVSPDRDDRTAIDKAVSIIKAFGKDAHIGLGVSELARRAELSKSTAFRVLQTLERNGVVQRAGTAYRVGRLLQELGGQSHSPDHDLARDLLTPYLADLYAATRLTAQLAVLAGPHVVYLNKLEGHQRLRSPSRIGGRMPAYSTGVGKMLLAHDSAAVEETMRTPRHAWTPNTIVDEDALRSELWQVRRRGVAIDHGESVASLACIAAPVMGAHGRPIAALSLSGDVSTFRPESVENILREVCASASRAAARTQIGTISAA